MGELFIVLNQTWELTSSIFPKIVSFWDLTAFGFNLALLPPGCVIIGELIDLSELQCPIYKM